jgi:hypothetical protein
LKALERTHGDYIANEPYYIFNFCLLTPEKQLDYFYVRELIPVEKSEHAAAVCLDCNYNYRIINPAYQMFISGFYPALRFMHFIESMCDFSTKEDLLICQDMEELVSNHFPESWQNDFFVHLENNTSRDGFLYGEYWIDLRKRCREFLEESGFIESKIEFAAPLKFSGFFYPDDFIGCQVRNRISIYGEITSASEWNELRKIVEDDYIRYNKLVNMNL